MRAGAEAAMVGALADWFAVTALFRHPLGIPIPHTAIIPRRKDQIGRSLGEFVEGNFLTQDVLIQRLESVEIGRRLGHWLAQPTSARRASAASHGRDARHHRSARRPRRAGSDRGTRRAPAAGDGRRTAAREGGRRVGRGRSLPAPARRRVRRAREVPEGERGDVAHSTQEGVAVVGARADRRPHLQEDPRVACRASSPTSTTSRTTRCGRRSSSGSACSPSDCAPIRR